MVGDLRFGSPPTTVWSIPRRSGHFQPAPPVATYEADPAVTPLGVDNPPPVP
jgi:hypothetical protein